MVTYFLHFSETFYGRTIIVYARIIRLFQDCVMFIRLITLATFIQPLYGITNVLKCPFGERGWKIREKEFKCQEGQTYHCLLDLNGRPVEACLKRKEYQRDGCPWVLETGEGTFFGEPLTSCNNERYCPSGEKSFYTNLLYIHPACLVAIAERLNFSLPDLTDHQVSTSTRSNSERLCETCQRELTIYKNLTFVLVGLYIFSVVIVVLFIIFIFIRRIDTCTNENHTGRRKYEHVRFAWELRETIRKGDNPENVHDMYMLLANIGMRNYMEILPKYENTTVSFLIYAAKQNRKETVLYFLQKYIDGSHVFTPDTYGVDSDNENIMHLAIRRGWTDVVEKLLEVDDNYFNNDDAINLAISVKKNYIVETLTRNKMA